MIRLLKFAVRFRGWQGYGKDQSTVRAVKRLCELDLLEVNEFRKFRLKVWDEVAEEEKEKLAR